MLRFVTTIIAALAATLGVANAQSDLVKRGGYLVNGLLTCGNCHTPKGPPAAIAGKDFSGGLSWDEPPFKVTAPNITPDKETGIGNYTDAQLKTVMRKGIKANGIPIAMIMPSGFYENYYDKVAQYVTILSGYAQKIEPGVTAKTFRPVAAAGDEETVFKYIDTASTRAEIGAVTAKLAVVKKIAIVGLGGTGSYVLDLVAKTPVREIHLFDGDDFLQHNAFRSPGAPSLDELVAMPKKAAYFKGIYDKMRNGIFVHENYIGPENVDELREMSFVFMCMEGTAKKLIVEKLEEFGLAFVYVGMGVYLSEGSLGGTLRVTTSTPSQRDHVRKRVSFSDDAGRNEYDVNIQIADLNALNAALAVIKWKKLMGFYQDLDFEHHCTYTIGGNMLRNEDVPAAAAGGQP